MQLSSLTTSPLSHSTNSCYALLRPGKPDITTRFFRADYDISHNIASSRLPKATRKLQFLASQPAPPDNGTSLQRASIRVASGLIPQPVPPPGISVPIWPFYHLVAKFKPAPSHPDATLEQNALSASSSTLSDLFAFSCKLPSLRSCLLWTLFALCP